MGSSPGSLSNDSANESGAWAAPGGIVYGADGQVIRQMIATVALFGGDCVLLDFATGPFNVTKTATADSVRRYGIVVGAAVTAAGVQAAAAGAPVWIAIEGVALAMAGAAIAQFDNIANGAVVAGRVKTAAAAGGHAQLGIAVEAAAGAGSAFRVFLDKA